MLYANGWERADLNKARIAGRPLKNLNFQIDQAPTRYLFQNLKETLVEQIRSCDVVVGCVAWLTDPDIIRELSRKDGVSIVVQKEEFLRPNQSEDCGWEDGNSGAGTRALYATLRNGLSRWDDSLRGTPIFDGDCKDPRIAPVRCVGIVVPGHGTHPRMHHKFAVFCDYYDEGLYAPQAAWSGSFNFTRTSSCSFEDATLHESPVAATVFFARWAQLAALSEPLDWKSRHMDPEWAAK